MIGFLAMKNDPDFENTMKSEDEIQKVIFDRKYRQYIQEKD